MHRKRVFFRSDRFREAFSLQTSVNGEPRARGDVIHSRPFSGRSAVLVVPGSVNYFYNSEGRRIAEALTALGCRTEITTLAESSDTQTYDWCFFFNFFEIASTWKSREEMLRKASALVSKCEVSAQVILECTETHWFEQCFQLMRSAGVSKLLDLAYINQSATTAEHARPFYEYLFDGFTEREKRLALTNLTSNTSRPIPWSVVGHSTEERRRLVDKLVREVDPSGLIYLPRHEPYREAGPHINEDQLDKVLLKSKYHIWCSHHGHDFLENIRIRQCLQAGCIPIKVLMRPTRLRGRSPFTSCMVDLADLPEQLEAMDWEGLRSLYIEEISTVPGLESSLFERIKSW